MSQETGTATKKAEVVQQMPEPKPPSLDDLLKLAGPLAETYFQSQERMQKQQNDFELKIMTEEGKRFRYLAIGGGILFAGVLFLSGRLIWVGNVDAAKDLLAFVVAVLAAAFGGYGIARSSGAGSEE